MIKKLTLKNFRQHEDRALNFGPGMNLVRGANEIGKTGALEAIAYAMFGVKALRDSLDETVTYGEATNTLRVDLVFSVGDTEYTLKRGKPGAEVTYPGGAVTGQTEVTNFVAKLLRVDAGAAAKLTMASQGEIRGALEAGPKATTELIERLAEFAQIDELVELIQEKLPLGSAAGAEAALAQIEGQLALAKERAAEPDTVGLEQQVEHLTKEVMWAERNLDAAEAAFTTAQAAMDQGAKVQAENQRLLDRLEQAQTRFKAALKRKVDAAQSANSHDVFEVSRDELLARQAQLADAPRLLAHYGRVKGMLGTVGGTERDDIDTVKGRMKLASAALREARDAGVKAQTDAATARAKLSSGTCGFCGQDFSALPEVARKNAELAAEIAAADSVLQATAEIRAACNAEIAELQAVLDDSAALLQPLPEHVERVGTKLPPSFRWTGPSPADLEASATAAKEVQATLDAMDRANRKQDLAQAALVDATAQAKEAEQTLSKAQDDCAVLLKVDMDALSDARATARGLRNDANNRMTEVKDALRVAQSSLDRVVQEWKAALSMVESLSQMATQRKLEVANLAFNNGLLKKVRGARPVIADKLWNIVLSAVSSYFSEIRGERSRVSKDSDGFKVDGHPISSLSGSTKDALGLAIRVALVRTFLPNTPFLLMDEPFSAMDQNRTSNLLGFLAGIGMAQTIVVTHEEVSESVADHIIILGD